ncbi:hypothetical protein TcCL_NonESM02780 [Trypanosoma cruzi]|uniref:Uncharacterized protein n=1 Tax=Trypanosoma cruzi (strain CL Brener) TaxID=353153 RepID=Q4CTS9_TRYCC|nr:hypothetical protein, conserved [Trypanosoma cruzi]EAN83675.1 hypothetical protein, conserved [Trypanosoma cruzi]RNC47307.1 hypothetical protein TcCL_NonESM02780 [Trypanosoma cruzi]|eukprot:XP_805526.1 hypothetical protein [Trypanosoma cruzi strain CL Brener]
MRALRLCGSRSFTFVVVAAQLTVVRASFRRFSRHEIVEAGERADDTAGDDAMLSTALPASAEDTFAGEFDELEAASQEIHDLCFAMISHLRKVDPDETEALFEKRCARRFRETIHENKRRLLHGHGSRGLRRMNCYRTRREYEEATQLFFQFGEKLLLLLTKPVMDRIVESAGRSCRVHRSDGVHKYRMPLERASWRGFPYRWFKHAPFEVQQLRADMPEVAVKNTRTMRDISTLRSLFTLMEPQHPFRSTLESRLFEITREYDAVQKPLKRGDFPSLPAQSS